MTESMASEPAEPTTRGLGRIERAKERLASLSPEARRELDEWWASAEAETSDDAVLADPAQTTEQHAERLDRALWLWAEEKWRREQLLAQREQWWESVAKQRGEVEVNRDALSLLLRGMARKLVASRKRWRKQTAERDLALWLHAEKQWWLDQYMHDVTLWKRQVDELTELAAESQGHARVCLDEAKLHAAERDERQARIDRAMVEIAAWWGTAQRADRVLMAVKSILSDLNLSALVGDQPKAEESKPRCCIGPFADGTHAPGCLDACQDCGGDEAGPHRCQCGDVDPVCTCTPSRCDYDGYPLDGPACLPCGQRPVGKPCLAIDDTPRAVEEADDAAGDAP